jgi:hypothetical protein
MLFAGLAAVGVPGVGSAEVRAELSQTELSQGQAVQLRLDASGSALAMPDLSVLQDDFQIANRNLRQQSSTVNGRRSQRITLTLTLIPLRNGELEIPAIRFGNEVSQALKLRVAAAASPALVPPNSNSVPAWEPPTPPSYGYRPPAAAQPQPGPEMSSDEYRPWTGSEGEHQPADDYRPQSAAAGTDESGRGWSLAAWGALGLGLLVFLTLLHRGGRRVAQGPPAQPPPVPPPPLSPALRAVRAAYEGDDADAARQALLEWGRQTWPDDAPTNLTRLAGRLEGPAKEAVLCLDQALYSPDPVAWADVASWEYLRAVKS